MKERYNKYFDMIKKPMENSKESFNRVSYDMDLAQIYAKYILCIYHT